MTKTILGALAALALVSGCGGGGGGGGGGSSGTPRFDCTSPATPEAPNISLSDTPTAQKALQYVFDTASVETLSYNQGKLWMVDIGKTITGSGDLACAGGGSANITDSDSDQSTLAVGDALSLSFNECRPRSASNSQILNGSMAMTVTSLSGGQPYTDAAWNLGLQMQYTNLQVGTTAAACGTANITINTAGAGSYNGTLTGSSYTVANATNKRTIGDYTFNYTEPELDLTTGYPVAGGAVRFSGNGKVRASDTITSSINGSVAFNVTSEFVGTYANNQGEGSLSQGALKVDGGSGTSVTMTALNATDVQLDLGSDGTPETNVSWASVLP